jgi:hypothetical protein
MQRVYEHAQTDEGLSYAQHVAVWVQTDYPSSKFADLSRNELAKSTASTDGSKTATAPNSNDAWSRFTSPGDPNAPQPDGSH